MTFYRRWRWTPIACVNDQHVGQRSCTGDGGRDTRDEAASPAQSDSIEVEECVDSWVIH